MSHIQALKPASRILSLSIVLLFFIQPTLQAKELENLFGEWGTQTQCARERITPKGTVFAAPFELQQNWLAHGDVWCRMNWVGVDSTPTGLVAFAQAFCGEDSVRDYQMKFKLEGDQLSLFWNAFYKKGPLDRCS